MTRRIGEEGSATLELAVLAPVLLVLLSLVIAAGRLEVANAAVEQAASAASREASLARSASQAQVSAKDAAVASLQGQGLTCGSLDVQVNTTGFQTAPGSPAFVGVSITCRVPLSDLSVPGLPGSRTLHAHMTSALDSYRSR